MIAPVNLAEPYGLRLDNALALLGSDARRRLPLRHESATAYLQALIDGLCELSSRDPLTGLGNRRHFMHALERELDRVARSGEVALLLILDIDHFKKVNDTYGHQAGDLVLQEVARCLTDCVRPMDTVARYGGEEFAVILPNCHASMALIVAERIRQGVQTHLTTVAPGVEVAVTLSIGGAFAPQWVRSTAALWTERADQYLYRAKADGRNRVCLEQQADSVVSAEEKSLLFVDFSGTEAVWSSPHTEAGSSGTGHRVRPM